LIIGGVTKFKRESSALKAIAPLRMEINSKDTRPNFMTIARPVGENILWAESFSRTKEPE